MKYKVGDRVKIKSLDWYNDNKNQLGRANCGSKSYTIEMCFFCGKILTIQAIGLDFYLMEEDNLGYEFTDEMIECKVEDTITTNEQLFELSNMSLEKEMEWNLPEGYQFVDENGNVIEAKKIILEKKKKEYPKTYEECAKVLLERASVRNDFGYKADLLVALQKLLVCRDAYWKIAGEEMGLGKPWEPDWEYDDTKYVLFFNKNEICHEMMKHTSYVLAFPTAEMRDAFYENFKKEIEICKELL